MSNKFAKFSDCDIMGLSNISILQQRGFFSGMSSVYHMRRVGSNCVFFKNSVKQPKRVQVTEKQLAALAARKFGGHLSRDQQKKMVSIVQNWSDTIAEMNAHQIRIGGRARFQINMLTITLSKLQHHDDKYIKRHLFVPFLAKLLKTNAELSYLWRAEPQENGNIHFHIFLDRYFDKDFLRREWNKTQSLHGYHEPLAQDSVTFGAPSTRVESLRSMDDAVQYAAKYISKNEGCRAIEGRLWGCSDSLRDLKPIEYTLTKQNVCDIIPLISDNNSNLWVSDYGCVVNYPNNWVLIQDSLRLNFSADLAIQYNVARLFTHRINGTYELKASEWYRAIESEYGGISTAYIEANYTLFPDLYGD